MMFVIWWGKEGGREGEREGGREKGGREEEGGGRRKEGGREGGREGGGRREEEGGEEGGVEIVLENIIFVCAPSHTPPSSLTHSPLLPHTLPHSPPLTCWEGNWQSTEVRLLA